MWNVTDSVIRSSPTWIARCGGRCACRGRIDPAGGMGAVGGRGDRQDFADHLAPVDGAVRVDEGDHFLNGRSNSASAKYADAFAGPRWRGAIHGPHTPAP
ncbi:hypothetical protein [Azospirillum doebereinerae]